MSIAQWVTCQQGIPLLYLAYVREFPRKQLLFLFFCAIDFVAQCLRCLTKALSLSLSLSLKLSPAL